MAALAYLVPPLSGLIAYVAGNSPRVRLHGLQSVLLGALWPAAMYLGSLLSPGATQLFAAAGAAVWLLCLVGTALGGDPRWPGVERWLEPLAEADPRAPAD